MSKYTVEVEAGTHFNRHISGTFELVTKTRDDGSCKRDHYLKVIDPDTGKRFSIHVFERDVKYFENGKLLADLPFGRYGSKRAKSNNDGEKVVSETELSVEENTGLTDEELDELIRKRFKIMGALGDSLIDGHIRALIISGAPGISKTYTLENKLDAALKSSTISKFTHLKGRVTPLQLFIKLFEHSNDREVLLLDDVDVFSDSDSLDILKGALDTGEKREITWASTLKYLEEKGIPQTFQFDGSICFITNKDFDREIAKKSNASIHYKALISRCNYLDLKVHTNREILIRVKQIVRGSELLERQGLTTEQGEEILKWLENNVEKLREISIRSVIKVAQYMKSDGESWEEMADVLMIKGRF